MKRNLTCIICPKGCALTVQGQEKQLHVTGNSCPRGEEYAVSECLHPVRTVTATVRVANRKNTMVSVKTEKPVAKEEMFTVMAMLRQMSVDAPLRIGDIILADACGRKVVATKEVQ